MQLSLDIIFLSLPFLGVIFVALIYLLRYILKQRKSHKVVRFVWEIISLPFSFTKIFRQQQKEQHLPLYFQYFLKFTRFCSRIPYFHFLPKFIVATIAEFLIHYITGEVLLTALIFSWSFFFFFTISIVESMYGDFNENVITLANKIFLFSVSIIFLFVLILWLFFWETTKKILENSFFQMISTVTEYFNDTLTNSFFWLLHLSLLGKIGILFVILIYIFSSLYLSKKGIK